jgi:hypothetical protein
MWSGYSVDKHGSYCAGGSLILLTQDPKNRPFWRVPGRFEKKELEDHLVELFLEGLSPHGWRFMLDRYDYIRDPITNDAFVNHTWQVEFVFEMVRRANLSPSTRSGSILNPSRSRIRRSCSAAKATIPCDA